MESVLRGVQCRIVNESISTGRINKKAIKRVWDYPVIPNGIVIRSVDNYPIIRIQDHIIYNPTIVWIIQSNPYVVIIIDNILGNIDRIGVLNIDTHVIAINRVISDQTVCYVG